MINEELFKKIILEKFNNCYIRRFINNENDIHNDTYNYIYYMYDPNIIRLKKIAKINDSDKIDVSGLKGHFMFRQMLKSKYFDFNYEWLRTDKNLKSNIKYQKLYIKIINDILKEHGIKDEYDCSVFHYTYPYGDTFFSDPHKNYTIEEYFKIWKIKN